MLWKVQTAEFRRNLKEYMDNVSGPHGDIVQLKAKVQEDGSPNKNDLFLLSKETLVNLQRRHELNIWAKNQFAPLKLGNYMTLAKGRETKGLPLASILGMSEFFGLIGELLDVLSCPGVKTNAGKWDVSEYIEGAKDGKKPDTRNSGRFDRVYAVIHSLYSPEAAFGIWGDERTLLQFFWKMHLASGQKTANGQQELAGSLKNEGLSTEQFCYLNDAIALFSLWAVMLIEFQPLDLGADTATGIARPSKESIMLQFEYISNWYADYIGFTGGQ